MPNFYFLFSSLGSKGWAQACNGKVLIGPLKNFARIFEKTYEDNAGDFSRLLDLNRSSIVL